MATTTPNYGWPVPTSTDYVKDGAVAIENLGDAIDATIGSFLNIRQIVTGNYAVETANSTTTYADTGLTATITPEKSTSQILVLVSQATVGKGTGNQQSCCNLKLFRGASELTFKGNLAFTDTNIINFCDASFMYLDSPATTSATTYKTQFANKVASASAIVQSLSSSSRIVLIEVGV